MIITSSQKELKNCIRLSIRPCSFCILKRTEKCEKEPPILIKNLEKTRYAKIPNLKRYYSEVCPSETIKSNLLKLIDCYFNEEEFNSSLSCFFEYEKKEYQKAIIDNVRNCSKCQIEDEELCKYCPTDDIKIDLLQLINEVFEKRK